MFLQAFMEFRSWSLDLHSAISSKDIAQIKNVGTPFSGIKSILKPEWSSESGLQLFTLQTLSKKTFWGSLCWRFLFSRKAFVNAV
jgi:succinylglutamate desuccinylase